MSSYRPMTPEESKDAHSKFFQRRIDAYQEDVDFIKIELEKAEGIGNIEKAEDYKRALGLAEAVLTHAKVTLARYLAGKPFINN